MCWRRSFEKGKVFSERVSSSRPVAEGLVHPSVGHEDGTPPFMPVLIIQLNECFADVLGDSLPRSCPRCRTKARMERTGCRLASLPSILHISCEYSPSHDLSEDDAVVEPPPTYYLDTLGCTFDRQIVLQGQSYRYLGTIMYHPLHFWSVMEYGGKVWRAGIECTGSAEPMAQPVYVTGGLERELHGEPVSHFYAIETNIS